MNKGGMAVVLTEFWDCLFLRFIFENTEILIKLKNIFHLFQVQRSWLNSIHVWW